MTQEQRIKDYTFPTSLTAQERLNWAYNTGYDCGYMQTEYPSDERTLTECYGYSVAEIVEYFEGWGDGDSEYEANSALGEELNTGFKDENVTNEL